MAAPSLAEIARAFTPDLNTDTELSRATQIANQQRQFDEQMKMKKEAEANRYWDSVREQLAPSNTIHDVYAIPRANEIMGRLSELRKSNPNKSVSWLQSQIAPEINKYHYDTEMAKLYDKRILDMAGQMEKDYPSFNRSQFIEDLRGQVFVNPETGKIDRSPVEDPLHGDYNLSNLEFLSKYTQPEALSKNLSSYIKGAYQPTPVTEYGVAHPEFKNIKGDVTASVNLGDRLSPDRLKVEKDYVPVEIDGKVYNVFNPAKRQGLPTTTEWNIAKMLELKNLSKDPNFSKLSPEQQEGYAESVLWDRYGQSEAGKPTKFDTSVSELVEKRRHTGVQESLAREGLALRRQQLAQNAEKIQMMRDKAKDDKVANKLVDAYVFATQPESKEYKNAESQIKPAQNAVLGQEVIAAAQSGVLSPYVTNKINQGVTSGDFNVNKYKGLLSTYDLGKFGKQGYFTDKATLKPFKPLLVEDKNSGKKVIVKAFIEPPTKDKKGNLSALKITGYEVIPEEMTSKELESYQQDFKMKESDFDKVFSAPQDFSEEQTETITD